MRRVGLTTLLALGAALTAAAPAAAITAVAPAYEDRTGPRPIFEWVYDDGETDASVYVATAPDVNIDGEFFSENVVDMGWGSDGETRYQDTSAMFAGRYYWMARSSRTIADDFQQTSTGVIPFNVAGVGRLGRVSFTRYAYSRSISFQVKYRTNVRRPKFRLHLSRRGRVIRDKTYRDTEYLPMSDSTFYFNWDKGTGKRGVMYRLTVDLIAGDSVSSWSRVMRAP